MIRCLEASATKGGCKLPYEYCVGRIARENRQDISNAVVVRINRYGAELAVEAREHPEKVQGAYGVTRNGRGEGADELEIARKDRARHHPAPMLV